VRRIVLLGLAVVLLGLMAPTAQAAPRLACGAVVTTSTKLKADLVCPTGTALRIEPDGAPVVLDLGGHEVRGTDVGIAASAGGTSGAVTVRNGAVTGFSTGISVAYAPGTRIEDVELVGPGRAAAGSVGVAVKASPAYVLDDATVKGFRTGLQVQAGDGGRISGSTLSRNGTAVSLTPSVYSLTVSRSRIRDNDQGFALSQSAMTVVRSQVSRNGVGISLFQSSATIRRTTIADNGTGIDGYSFESRINLSDSTVRSNGTGVRLLDYGLRGTANVIEGNTIKDNDGAGLVLDLTRSLGAPALTIADNRFLDNGDDPVDAGVAGVSDQGLAVRVAEGAGSVVVTDNQARRNAGIGIDAVGVTDGGGNTARGNGGSTQCVGVVCAR
jgi:hypothetical protein